MRFPAENFIAFFDNHRLIHWNRPRWRTVKGGSRSYVERLVAANSDRIRFSTAVTAIYRRSNGVEVVDAHGVHKTYDQVIIATHSDEALALLADPSPAETSVLGAIRYRPNDVYLHRDTRLMPKRRRAWSAWNFIRDGSRGGAGQEVAISYWMNALQGIDADKPLFVTLNPPTPPAPALTFRRFSYAHPQYDLAAFAAQRQLDTIQGARRTWFCGAWAGYGFHEDGLKAAITVARQLGVAPPWETNPAGVVSEAAE
jgi:predicted NAD/FAD-binding protein